LQVCEITVLRHPRWSLNVRYLRVLHPITRVKSMSIGGQVHLCVDLYVEMHYTWDLSMDYVRIATDI
jgi:hypothetical protein